MTHYTYLVIGGGMAGDAAVNGIRQVDARGSIGLIGHEPHPPYNRPPLSKSLWKGKPLRIIWRQDRDRGVTCHLGVTATALDLPRKQVADDRGGLYSFDKLLLATGGSPRRLPLETGDIIYFRTLDDYQRLRSISEGGQRLAVIGGGFTGSEIAAALASNGKSISMIFEGGGIGSRLFPGDLALFLNDYYRKKGVEVLPHHGITGIQRRGERWALEGVIYYLDDGRVRGVLLWNVWKQVEAARKLIAEPGPIHPSDLHGRLPVRVAEESHVG